MKGHHNDEWYLEEKEEFLVVKYFQNTDELTNYINNNKEIKEKNYHTNSNGDIFLELSLEDYLSLPSKLKNR